ncbi:MAG: hypothetical protein Kow006_21860 [Gammaproteobacteria bacterium]
METPFLGYCRQHRLRSKLARLFKTYDPHAHPSDDRVVNKRIVPALQNKPITICGDGNQTRSLCCVDDLIEGFVHLMNSSDELTGPVNLGNPGELAVRETVEVMIHLTESRSMLTFRPFAEDDPKQSQPGNILARETLGWQPATPLREGLLRTREYFEGHIWRDGSKISSGKEIDTDEVYALPVS